MKFVDIKTKTTDELNKKLIDLKELYNINARANGEDKFI